MSLRSKSFFVFFFGIAFSLFALVFSSYFFLLKRFELIEIEETKGKLIQIREIVEDEIDRNDIFASDWAVWDDTYQFVFDVNKRYIDSNLQNETFLNTGWDFIFFVNEKGEVVYKKAYDRNISREFVPDDILIEYVRQNDKWGDRVLLESKISGLLYFDGKYALISALSILKSNGEGPFGGVLITGFFLDDRFISRVSKKIGHELIVISNDQAEFEGRQFPYNYKDANLLISARNRNILTNYVFFDDINNKPLLAFKVYFPRAVYLQGLRTVSYFLLFFLSSAGAVMILYYFFFYSIVVNRLNFLFRQIRKISGSRDFSLRIQGLPSDEFGELGANINIMLDALQSLKQEIDEKNIRLESQNKDLEDLKTAMFNILEDEREAKEELKLQKESIESLVKERTKELEDANIKLSESWIRLKTAIESLPLGLILVSSDNRVIVANKKVGEILDLDKENFSCENIRSKFTNFDILSYCEMAKNNRKISRLQKISYGNKILNITFVPVIKDNAVIGSVFLVEDVTEEENLQRARDEFFSIASHELRTPLTSIRGNASMILDYFKHEIKDKNLFEMIKDIHESSVRLIKIVNDFLNVSRLELGKINFKIEDFNLISLIDESIEELGTLALEKGLYLKKQSRLKKMVVSADKEKTKQVLINLMGNGIKFTKKGGVKINVENTGDGFVKILVEDTGIGIPEDRQSLLFRKFQQAEENILTRDVTEGTGLGLYVSKMLVEKMGGNIGLERSEEGKGSVFFFTLPIAKSGERV